MVSVSSRSLLIITMCLLFGSCQRPEVQSGQITIDTKQFRKAMLQSSVWPPENQTCFAVDARGSGINEDSPGGACSGSFGIRAGFVPAGGALSLSIPRGEGRNCRIYMFRKDSEALCPSLDQVLSDPTRFGNLHMVAESLNVSINKEEQILEIKVAAPAVENSFAMLRSGQCQKSDGQAGTLQLVVGRSLVKNANGSVELKVISKGVMK